MVEVRFAVETTASPESVLAAATDFSDRRPELWPNIDPRRYRVHAVGATSADVTEGSKVLGGIWARERYDWSAPGVVSSSAAGDLAGVVRAQVSESNVFRPGSTWQIAVRPGSDGGSTVEWVARREPKGLRGRVVVLLLRLAGPKIQGESFRRTLDLLERGAVA